MAPSPTGDSTGFGASWDLGADAVDAAAATRDMFTRPGTPAGASTRGHLASGVPGTVAGLAAALEQFGSVSREVAMAPAVALARDGFIADEATAATP